MPCEICGLECPCQKYTALKNVPLPPLRQKIYHSLHQLPPSAPAPALSLLHLCRHPTNKGPIMSSCTTRHYSAVVGWWSCAASGHLGPRRITNGNIHWYRTIHEESDGGLKSTVAVLCDKCCPKCPKEPPPSCQPNN